MKRKYVFAVAMVSLSSLVGCSNEEPSYEDIMTNMSSIYLFEKVDSPFKKSLNECYKQNVGKDFNKKENRLHPRLHSDINSYCLVNAMTTTGVLDKAMNSSVPEAKLAVSAINLFNLSEGCYIKSFSEVTMEETIERRNKFDDFDSQLDDLMENIHADRELCLSELTPLLGKKLDSGELDYLSTVDQLSLIDWSNQERINDVQAYTKQCKENVSPSSEDKESDLKDCFNKNEAKAASSYIGFNVSIDTYNKYLSDQFRSLKACVDAEMLEDKDVLSVNLECIMPYTRVLIAKEQ